MIRDTCGQDRVLPTNSTSFYRRSVALWLVATALLLIAAYFTLMPSSRSVRVDRLRLATVERGTLIRDASVNGRIVAAASPALYAPAVSTVDLRIRAGDKVKRGDVLAVLESPELNNLLKREQACYDQLEIEILRQRNLSEKQKLLAQRDAEQAGIELTAAERLLLCRKGQELTDNQYVQRIKEIGVLDKSAELPQSSDLLYDMVRKLTSTKTISSAE